MRLVPSFLLAAVAVAPAVHAQVADFEYPPPPEGMSFEPMRENPYFVRDDEDPRFLQRAPGAEQRGIDRGYVEMMVRGDLPRETLDLLERDAPGAVTTMPLPSPPDPTLLPFQATAISGNVIVIEGTEQLVPMTERGRMFNHNGNGLQMAIGQVWNRLGDNFDFITVMTTFEDPGAAGYYLPLRQDVTGLGECNTNTGATFGCVFDQLDSQLQGFVFMNSLGYWRSWDRQMDGIVHPIASFDSSVYAVMGQEIGHRWGAGLRFKDPRTGATSKKLLGRDESHWAAWVDTDASIHDGWDWEPEGNNFVLVDDMRRFSTLDLYAMGALPVASAKPFFFIDNARFVPNALVGNVLIPAEAALQIPSVEWLADNYGVTLKASGERVDLDIQDIVDAEGNRCPDPDHTQKSFRQAIVLVTAPGQTVQQVQPFVQELELMMATWEDWWRDRTNKALTLCTSLTEGCEHNEMTIGEGVIEDETEDDIVEPGEYFELIVPVSPRGNSVIENAVAHIRLEGNGAEDVVIVDKIELGDLNSETDLVIPMEIGEEYGCGLSVIARVTVESDNAPSVSGEYRIFPGYKQLFAATFDDGEDGFTPNQDGLDENTRGGFVHGDVMLNCAMSPRTPEKDASAGQGGAFVTGNEGVELDGVTSLFSPEIPLDGAVDPEIRFMYWLDGAAGSGKLKVSVSGSGKGFTEAKVYEEPYHGWILGRVVLSEVYEEIPASVYLLIEAEGDGRVEAAIDEVRVLDRAGSCAVGYGGCMCAAEPLAKSGSKVPYGAFALGGLLLALAGRRRRARR